MIQKTLLIIGMLFALSGCSESEDRNAMSSGGGMKCGAGKCGANMFDGNFALDKKKKNILSQMREDDDRKACVMKAPTTKEVYNCVRDPKTQRLSLKCGTSMQEKTQSSDSMQCGGGMKCGGSMQCGAGKCGGS